VSRPRFVHLQVHSEYSVVDGLIRIDDLVARLAGTGMAAAALTEQCNLFSLVKFYQAAERRGVKPIIGADLYLAPQAGVGRRTRITCLVENLDGYRTLTRLLSRAYIEGSREGQPEIAREWLQAANTGLILLAGGREGDIGHLLLAGQMAEAERLAHAWQADLGERFCLAITRTGRAGEEEYLRAAVPLAARLGIPLVATNDVRFLAAADFSAHEARVCIFEGCTLDDPRRPRGYSPEQYLKDEAEMCERFADLPEALANTVAIAERCNLELTLGQYFLPAFPTPQGEPSEDWLMAESRRGLTARLEQRGCHLGQSEEAYRQRLEHELAVICGMGFSGYFLIVADFIRWAREHQIPVGPGRGSGAGSLVAYALGITDLDPLAYDLLFERFLNPERVSMPDFDVDFCMDRRDEVIDYVATRYGRDRVTQIITHGTMAAKAVIRDAGRVLGLPYGFCDQIAKLVPFELDMTLAKALKEPALAARYEAEEDVRTLLDLARQLEGLVRNAGRHAGGVVIAPGPLTDFTALYCESGSTATVTQLDMADIEAVGLVKFDFLGLRTLTIIDWAVEALNAERATAGLAAIDIATLPLADSDTFALIRRAETVSVFQLESRGMRELIKRLAPDTFEDLIALVALFRPGPLQSGMVDDFCDRKHGRAPVLYPHPTLEGILKPTYGVIVYQEQVMQIAQVLAGYSLGAADLLRRAMGKKKPEEMARQRSSFTEGAKARGIDPVLAESIFDLMEKFAGYGFNKSHSAAYALVAYQTAWLKTHYPAHFMSAVLSADMDHTDKVVGLINECRRMNLRLLPPDIHASQYRFTVAAPDAIRYGLGAVRGVGLGALEGMFNERARGRFRDLFDLCQRIDTRKLNRRALEALIKCGALDDLGAHRASLLASLEAALCLAGQAERNAEVGQDDLFGLGAPLPDLTPGGRTTAAASADASFVNVSEWDVDSRLMAEKETLGLYLTGHPFDRWRAELDLLTGGPLDDLRTGRRCVAGLMLGIRVLNSRRGRMAVATLDDGTARVECTLYSEVFGQAADLLVKDQVIVIDGQVAVDDFTGGFAVTAERVFDLDGARATFGRQLAIEADLANTDRATARALFEAMSAHAPGRCPVLLRCREADAEAWYRLGERWRVRPTEGLLTRLRALPGITRAMVEYPPAATPAE